MGLVIAVVLLGSSCTGAEATFRPTFATVDCPDEVAVVILSEHSCGYLTVLEDREKPDGRTIRLFVVRSSHRVGTPLPIRCSMRAPSWH